VTPVSHFRSSDFEAGDQLAILHDVYASVERVNIDVLGEADPYFHIALRNLPDVSLLSAAISPMSPHRTRAQASDGKDDLVFAFIEAGKARFTPQGGDELELASGDAYLGINTRASRHTLVDTPKFFDITIPRAVLDPRVKIRDYATVGRLMPSPALALLKHYAQALMRIETALDDNVARQSADHLLDLAALALGAHPDAAEMASGNGLAFARLGAIQADIRRNLAEPWLTLDAIARRHGISTQYLRSLFYREETSFSVFVRDEKLAHARAMLGDPGKAQWRISQIAFACGFNDLSNFNKRFRERYGMSPSDARSASLQDPSQ